MACLSLFFCVLPSHCVGQCVCIHQSLNLRWTQIQCNFIFITSEKILYPLRSHFDVLDGHELGGGVAFFNLLHDISKVVLSFSLLFFSSYIFDYSCQGVIMCHFKIWFLDLLISFPGSLFYVLFLLSVVIINYSCFCNLLLFSFSASWFIFIISYLTKNYVDFPLNKVLSVFCKLLAILHSSLLYK